MNGTTSPTDTAAAAINIAHNPTANTANLYAMPAAASPFYPALTAQPYDFTIAINFTGGGISYPQQVVVDSSGNAWVIDRGSSASSITEITPSGAFAPGHLLPVTVLLTPPQRRSILSVIFG